jgi:hypothetical protein
MAQPRLQRFQIVEKPRKRRLLRGLILVGNMITALLRRLRVEEKPKKRHRLRNTLVGTTIAAAAFVAVFTWWRRGRSNGAGDEDRRGAQATFPEPKRPDAEPDRDGAVTDADAPQDIAMPVPA